MSANGWLQFAFYSLVLLATVRPVGIYMTRVLEGQRTWLDPVFRPFERLIYKLCGVNSEKEMNWREYAYAMLGLSAVSLLLTYGIERLQAYFPFNPQKIAAVGPDLAWNTAASFTTNTNWQSYTPETTMSYLTQMAALATHNFWSAAIGIVVAVALIRGIKRTTCATIGNFWVDMTRTLLYILLPASFISALLLVAQGVPQNLHAYTAAHPVEQPTQVQTIAQGPTASQEAIKMLGTNGGGFFNANSAHPFENPTPFANFLQVLYIFVIPAGLTYTFGKMVRDTRQGWALFAAMSIVFLAGVFVVYPAEQSGNPNLTKLGVEDAATATQPGGNMEGKEVRFGIPASALFAVVTTDASCGAVNSMHDSFTPLGGMVPMVNIQLGEVIFGGVGAGLYGMLMYAILAVFLAGLMVGRTPEYLCKKIEQKEVKMAMLAMLILAASILLFSAGGIVAHFAKNAWINPPGPTTENLTNHGPHGLSEMLYAYTSGTGNNGSAFGGLSPNTPFFNTTIGFAMLIGRFLMMIPLLAAAGSLAQKKMVPVSAGTFPTHGALFVGWLVAVILIVGALTFFPALSLGPIVEHFLMNNGKLFSVLITGFWS